MSYLKDKVVLLTGASGFLGSHVLHLLKGYKPSQIITPKSLEVDLRKSDDVERLFKDTNPDTVIHIAGKTGGIEENRKNPADFFYDNASMSLNLVHLSSKYKVKKFVGLGTVCSYPKITPIPFREENLWNGYPEETTAPYGLGKSVMMIATSAYQKQYGLKGVHLLAVNLYGPGDNFNLHSAHVLPSLVSKFVTAKENNQKRVSLFGDGSPTREFLYVEDCARGILLAAENYESSEPVNLGSGMEISIKDLATKIASIVDYRGEIFWDTSKPNGQPRRCLDVSRAYERFGFRAQVDFDTGLKRTIDWYRANGSSKKRIS